MSIKKWMNDKEQQSKTGRFARLLLGTLILVAFVAWGCTSPTLSSSADRFTPTILRQGWSQQLGDAYILLDDIQEYTAVEVGESLTFTCTLPEIQDGYALLFYSVNKEVYCYIDGELVHDFSMQQGFEMLKTPGNAWNQIDLDSSMSGKTCTLVFHSPLGRYRALDDIYLIESQYVDIVRTGALSGPAFSAILVFFIIIIVMAAAFAWHHPRRKRYFFAIAQYFAVVLLWMLARMNFYDLFFARPIVSYLLLEILRRMMPLALLYLAKNSTNQYWHPNIIRTLVALSWANLLVPLVLPFTLGISFLALEVVQYAVSGLVIVVLFLISIEKLCHLKKLEYEEYPFLALPILLVSSAYDVLTLSMYAEENPFIGMWTAVGCLTFSLVTFVLLTHVNSRIALDKTELEGLYSDLENTTLIQQIEAHFIFNVLNTISAYCKTDPAQADKAIHSFAGYLRSYLHLIEQRENIPIQDELALVKHYLTLQQMRFGEKLRFCVEGEILDVDVPPFVVHTIVENSVKHGIKNYTQGGVVRISTKRVGNAVQLIIADSGAGFDVTQPRKETSVGLRNAEKRLRIMRHATMTIESEVGVGTTVVMTLPMDDAANGR